MRWRRSRPSCRSTVSARSTSRTSTRRTILALNEAAWRAGLSAARVAATLARHTPMGEGAMARFASILETVGNTPVVRINRLAPAGIDLYAKVEAFNPLGSVKDRLALGVIE